MIKPIKFKKSIFGGFNRREVINYINYLDETITSLESEKKGLISDNNLLKEKLDDAAKQLNDINKLSSHVNNSDNEQNMYENVGFKSTDGFEVREEIINDLMDEDDYKYETKDVHDLSLDIGNILLAARECADDIIKEAEDKSKEMKLSALKSSERLIDTLNKTQIYLKSLNNDINEAFSKFESEWK